MTNTIINNTLSTLTTYKELHIIIIILWPETAFFLWDCLRSNILCKHLFFFKQTAWMIKKNIKFVKNFFCWILKYIQFIKMLVKVSLLYFYAIPRELNFYFLSGNLFFFNSRNPIRYFQNINLSVFNFRKKSLILVISTTFFLTSVATDIITMSLCSVIIILSVKTINQPVWILHQSATESTLL